MKHCKQEKLLVHGTYWYAIFKPYLIFKKLELKKSIPILLISSFDTFMNGLYAHFIWFLYGSLYHFFLIF